MIYADNAATTRISDTALESMIPFLREQYGNASSQYSLGLKSKRAIENARRQVATAIGSETSEITFTSGGSEANSWILRSATEEFCNKPIHIITSVIEHHSILNACHFLEANGVEVTYLPVNAVGQIAISDVEAAIKPHTKLVSIMMANNEIGTIQPIEEIGRLLKDKNIPFHTDAVQAVGHIPVDVSTLSVDYLTSSAHKFHGAKGTGILYKRTGSKLSPLVFGGKQERGLRAGTENVAGIVAAGYALEESVACMLDEADRLKTIVEITISRIKETIPTVVVNGDGVPRLPGIINFCFEGVSGEAIMHQLDLKGICVSTSSACTAGTNQPSHVLLALGLSERQAKCSIRISYGSYNTLQEADEIITAICTAYRKIVDDN